MTEADLDADIRDMLEDSLTYSPLKDVTNKENSPASFFNKLERARKSPSTVRLFSLLGHGNQKVEQVVPSPNLGRPTPKRLLQEFLDSPGNRSPDQVGKPVVASELSAEISALQSSLAIIQKDCEFHRQRAVASQDQVDHLNKYVALLEEENRKAQRRVSDVKLTAKPADDKEKAQLRLSVDSMEALNRSLARQNDLLRSRSSVTARFSQKDAKVQTDDKLMISTGTDPSDDHSHLPFMSTPSQLALTPISSHHRFAPSIRESACQTETGVWATVEDITQSILPSLPIAKRGRVEHTRRSLPSYSAYPTSPHSNPVGTARTKGHERHGIPKPLLAPVTRTAGSGRNAHVAAAKASYVFVSRSDWRPIGAGRKGKSTGSVQQKPRWIP